MREVKSLKKPMGVAGLGLEYRTCEARELAEVGTAAALANQYGCKGTELISCDGVSYFPSILMLLFKSRPRN